MTGNEWGDLIDRFGIPLVMFFFALWSGYKKLWVFGWVYDLTLKEKDKWQQLALHGTTLADESTRVVERVVEQKTPEDVMNRLDSLDIKLDQIAKRPASRSRKR